MTGSNEADHPRGQGGRWAEMGSGVGSDIEPLIGESWTITGDNINLRGRGISMVAAPGPGRREALNGPGP